MIAALALAALLAPSSPQNTGDDWTRFRGPNGLGVNDSVPLPGNLDPSAATWRVEVPRGFSSPVVRGGRIFLTGHADERLFTLALDLDSGAELWRREAPRAREEHFDERNDPASPSAAVDAERVVVFFPEYGLLAYDHDGQELWRTPLGPFNNIYGMGASPILVDGTVILACDQSRGSYVAAFSGASGEELWRSPRPWAKSGHCTPVVHRPGSGAAQVLLPGSFYLDAYDVTTGARVWWVSGLCPEMKSVPVLHEGVVYINGYASPLNQPGNQVEVPEFAAVIADRDADDDGAISAEEMIEGRVRGYFPFLDLDESGTLDGEEWQYLRDSMASLNGMLAIRVGGEGDRTQANTVWAYRRSVPQLPSPLIYRDVLYMLNDQGGLLTTFEPLTGEVLQRGRVAGFADAVYAAPVAGGGQVILASESGLVAVLPAGGSLEPKAVFELGESIYATPALVGGTVLLRSTEALYAFRDDD